MTLFNHFKGKKTNALNFLLNYLNFSVLFAFLIFLPLS